MKLGEVIYQYRTANKMTLDDFAKRSGLSRAYISFLEHGRKPGQKEEIRPSVDTMRRCAVAMGMSTDDLLDMVDEGRNNLLSMSNVDWSASEMKEIADFCKFLLWKRDNA